MKWKVHKICEKESVTAKISEMGVHIAMEPVEYACAECISEIYPCVGNSVYRIVSDIPTQGAACRLILNWYKGTQSVARRYIDGTCEVVSPENVDGLSVVVMINGSEKKEIVFSEFTYERLRAYEPKMVKLASVSIGYMSTEEANTLDKQKLMDLYVKYIDEAGRENPDVILLTEHFHNIGLNIPYEEKFITMEDEVIKTLQTKAAEYHTYIAGSVHRIENGYRYNTAILIDRKGEVVGMYDKTHLTMSEYEKGITPGKEIPVFETDFGKVGFLICWDAWFPVLSQILYRKGVKLILNPSLGAGLTQAYAITASTGCYMLTSNGDKRWCRVQNPLGEVITPKEGGNVVIASVDLDEPYWLPCLSVGRANGDGRNIYLTEARDDLYREYFMNNKVMANID